MNNEFDGESSAKGDRDRSPEESVLATRRFTTDSGQQKYLEERSMSKTLFQRIATTLLPLLLAACATTGGAQNTPTREDGRARLAKAEAMFAERCKKSGEFIHRTAENVEGVFLMKPRPTKKNHGDQYKMDDPYGADVTGNGYISLFLLNRDTKGSLVEEEGVASGYRYAEALDPKDGKRYRYTGSMKVVGRKNPNTPNHQVELARNPNFDLNNYAFVLDKVPAPGSMPRYGVTYDDISTREERDYWIAGSSLKVIDLQASEVMAERIGYMMDRGQGDRNGGRSPWLFAEFHACPEFPKTASGHPFKGYQTRNFVEKVLHINQAKKDN